MGRCLTILRVSHRKPGTASRTERALFWHCAKPFLHPIARSAAHGMSKIPPIEFQNLQDMEMKRFIEFKMEDGGAIIVEVNEPETGGTTRASRRPGEIAEEAKEIFE